MDSENSEILDFPKFEPKNITKTYLAITPPKKNADKKNFQAEPTNERESKLAEKVKTAPKKVQELTTKNAVTFLLSGTLANKVCKYCLKETDVLYELDKTVEVANHGGIYSVAIRDMIACFYPFKVTEDPNLPNKICERCLDRTIATYLFTQQCEQSDRALTNCFEDIYTKFSKLDPIDSIGHKRGRKKMHPNYDKITVEHAFVIDYADPVINIINSNSEPLSKDPKINPLECLKCCQVLPDIQSLTSHSNSHPKSMWYTCRLCAKSFPKLNLLKKHFKEHENVEIKAEEEKRFECKECSETHKNYQHHYHHIEKHRFKMVLEHVLYRKTDVLCAVCLDKGNLVRLDELVSFHGGPPDLMGELTMQGILNSALPELQKNITQQFTGSKICEKCVSNAITSYTFAKNAFFIRDRLNTCITKMLENLDPISVPESNLCIEIANETILPTTLIETADDDDDDVKSEVFLEDEYRIKSEDEEEDEIEKKDLNHSNEVKNEVHMNGYESDVHEFLTFKKQKQQKIRKNYTCPMCDKHFLSDYFVKRHIFKHLSKKVKCDPCGTEFGNTFSLNEHTKFAHVLFQSDYKACKVCGRGFRKADKLKQHEKQHSNKKCLLCNKIFKNQRYHDLHMKRHIPKLIVLKKMYGKSCSFCEKECANDNQLSLHVNKIHLQIKPYSCDMCEKKFYTEYNLRFHKKIHSKLSKEKCNFCSKIVKSRKLLVIHIRKHIGVTPHNCVICNQAFYSQAKLKKHMNLTHGGTFVCKICRCVCTTKSELKQHVTKLHSFL